jgi:hypothetical protein
MIFRRCLIASLLIAACIGTARADWQNTRWGMTESQVAKLPGLALSDARHESGLAINGLIPSYTFPYRSGALTFQGALYFGGPNRGLSQVALRLDNHQDWPALVAALTQRYGQPAKDSPMSMASRVIRWYTPREEIQYFHQLVTSPQGSATVYYIARDPASSKGL